MFELNHCGTALVRLIRPMCPDRSRSGTPETLRDAWTPTTCRLGAERSLVQIQSPRLRRRVPASPHPRTLRLASNAEDFGDGERPSVRAFRPTQNNLISRFTRMVSAIESTIDQTRQPGMRRTCVRSPDRFQITNILTRLPRWESTQASVSGSRSGGYPCRRGYSTAESAPRVGYRRSSL